MRHDGELGRLKRVTPPTTVTKLVGAGRHHGAGKTVCALSDKHPRIWCKWMQEQIRFLPDYSHPRYTLDSTWPTV